VEVLAIKKEKHNSILIPQWHDVSMFEELFAVEMTFKSESVIRRVIYHVSPQQALYVI